MNKKVIYISLLCTPVHCLESISDAEGPVSGNVWEYLRAPERCLSVRENQITTWLFWSKKVCGEFTVVIKRRQEARGLSGANWGQRLFLFSGPSHQIHGGRPPEQIIPFKQHRRKQFMAIHTVNPGRRRWKRIIHHHFASGQWPNSVNSLLSFLMHYIYFVRESTLAKSIIMSSLKNTSHSIRGMIHGKLSDWGKGLIAVFLWEGESLCRRVDRTRACQI